MKLNAGAWRGLIWMLTLAAIRDVSGAVANVTVENLPNGFVPATTNISVNDEVIWTWPTGSDFHNVTSTSAPPVWTASATLSGPATFTNTFTSAGSFPYICTVHGFTGAITVAAVVNETPIVSITAPASDSSFPAPATVTVTAAASSASATVTNVSFYTNGFFAGAIASAPFSLTLSNLLAGNYGLSAVASAGGTSATSAVVNITVVAPQTNLPPTIIVEPVSGSALSGGSNTFSVLAVGSSPLSFQWFFNGSPLAGSTNSALALIDLVTTNTGSYTVVITNAYGAITSLVAMLSVLTNNSVSNIEILTSGSGMVVPNDNGKSLEIGHSYVITAVAARDWLFAQWSGSIVTNTARIRFVMQSNMVLQANFVTNIFLAAHGAYHGLFAPSEGMRAQTDSGAFTFSLTTAGAISGQLMLGAERLALHGKFDPYGDAQLTSPVRGQAPLVTTLHLNVSDQSVEGSVSNAGFVASLTGDLDVFTAHQTAANFQGRYTLTIPGVSDPVAGPYGASYGTVVVSPSGAISFAGSLADGTAVTSSSVVSKDGYWPFYLLLYNGNGSIWAWNYFTNHTISAAPAASWINGGNTARNAVLGSGFTNQSAQVTGAFYTVGGGALDGVGAGQVTLQDGASAAPITVPVTISPANAITPATNTANLRLVVNKTTGIISGSFIDPLNPPRPIKVNGVIEQNATNIEGYFLENSESGSFLIQP